MINKRICRFVAQFAMVAMVFGQLAMTAYACPMQGAAPPTAMMCGAPRVDAGEGPCAGMNVSTATSQGNACEFHCSDGVTFPAQPDLPQVALAALPTPAIAHVALAATNGAVRTPLAASPGAPPLILQFCRLLI